MHPKPDLPGPNQESVWTYPRPAIAQPITARIQIIHHGLTIADSSACVRTLETSHPPSYYIPPNDIAAEYLRASVAARCANGKAPHPISTSSSPARPCATSPGRIRIRRPAFAMMAGYLAFYAAPFDTVLVDARP